MFIKSIILVFLFGTMAYSKSWHIKETTGFIASKINDLSQLEGGIYYICYRKAIIDIGFSDIVFCGESETRIPIQKSGKFKIPKLKIQKGNSDKSRFEFRLYHKAYGRTKLLNKVDLKYNNRKIAEKLKQLKLYKLPSFNLPIDLLSNSDIDTWLQKNGRELKLELEFSFQDANQQMFILPVTNLGNRINNPRYFDDIYFMSTKNLQTDFFDMSIKINHPYYGSLFYKKIKDLKFPINQLKINIDDRQFVNLNRDPNANYLFSFFDFVTDPNNLSQYKRKLLFGEFKVECRNNKLAGYFIPQIDLQGQNQIFTTKVWGLCDGEELEIEMEIPNLHKKNTPMERVKIYTNEVRYLNQFSRALVSHNSNYSSHQDEVPVYDARGVIIAYAHIKE